MKGPTKSGFAAGRSSNGTARSSMANSKTPPKKTKAERAREKVDTAQRQMREIIAENDDPPWDTNDVPAPRDSGGGLLGTPIRKKRRPAPTDGDEDGDDEAVGASAALDIQLKVRARFGALRDYIGVDNEDYNAEAANRLLLRSFLSSMMDLYPEAVETYLKTRKEQAGYVVAAFATQARDINTELRMVSDAEGQAAFINQRIVMGMFTAFTQMLLAEGMALRNTVNTQLPNHPRGIKINTAVDKMLKELGKFMDASRARVEQDIAAYLNGDLSVVNSDSAGGKRKRGRRAN